MAVRIVTDSTADLPPELARELGITVVPLTVIFDGVAYRDGLDIQADDFYARLQSSKSLPTTAAPAPADFAAAYDSLLNEKGVEGIVSIHLSGKLSATYNNACQAAEGLGDKSEFVAVFDSKSGSLGTGLQVILAARAAAGGATSSEVLALLKRYVDKVKLVFVVDTLEYLQRGGRIGRARAFLGNLLQIKPILSVRDGEIYPEERVRTRRQALDRLFQLCAQTPFVQEIGVVHATTPEEADELQRRFRAAFPAANIYFSRLGPALGVHLGPGVIGAGVLQREA